VSAWIVEKGRSVDLFIPVIAPERFHPNFQNALLPGREGEREVVSAWLEGFKDRDGKLVTEFQTTFNSTFWEIYLHAVFREYGFQIDWSHSSPDFVLDTPKGDIVVEAVTANAAQGAVPEWDKPGVITDNVRYQDFWPLNREAIIRLSNALLSKLKKHRASYASMGHVKGKPFVVAVAPFEQPDFQHQYDRPMRALLYDEYVDETAYFKNPDAFPNGPPSVKLASIEKGNGATIDLGIFNNDSWREVSAVVFSCVATWGKTVAMSNRPAFGFVITSWGTDETGKSERRVARIGPPSEAVTDGLQVFHNPHALIPLDLEVFRRSGVVQHYVTPHGFIRESYENCLQFRLTQKITFHGGGKVATKEKRLE
jgi:hypothetical protein